MKTHHIPISVIALGVLIAVIVIVTHGFALLLLVPVALIVGALIPLFMMVGGRTKRPGK
jgi:Flp pilus assembly protein TadB